ncbi:hypothetical protein AB0H69_42830 [Streptomyces phaeochromogenes]|uniref:hypothetical protein n=1 Tax=Streptomyces phaeochromogenes TaxID=1923 RepID=UPI0033E72364
MLPQIAGAGQGGSGESTSPSASAAGSGNRPEIAFPSDAENVFENWETSDATKDAVLTDAQGSVDAVDDAILRGDKDSWATSPTAPSANDQEITVREI